MKCVNCGSEMEEYKSYMEGDELIMKYRCSCGYEDSKVINGKPSDELEKPKGKSVNKYD